MLTMRFDWRLRSGIASPANTCALLVFLGLFAFLVDYTGVFGVANVKPQAPEHTRAYVTACLALAMFLWACFAIALFGIRQQGTITSRQLISARWNSWRTVARDLAIATATLLAMGTIGSLSNVLLGPFQRDIAAFRTLVSPQNSLEALAFLASAFTAGFVEEFVFRGYLQRQFQALFGNTMLAATAQVLVFTAGHYYQGWARLIPVLLIGFVLTAIALWRKSLAPGMIAHGLGDGLVAFSYFAKHL